MKEIQDIITRLKKFYQSLAQIINSGGVVVLNRFDAETALTLIKQLNVKVKVYNKSCSMILNDIQSNLFTYNPDGTIGINPFRFGKLEAVLIYLESSDFVCAYAKYINTPWEDINLSIKKLLEDSAKATDRLSYNQVGVLSREIFILLAQKVYKEEMNDNEDCKKISIADAKGMLGCYISYVLKGSSYKELRNYTDNPIKLAEHVTHTKTEDKASMESVVTAVIALVSVINIIYKNYDV